MTVHRFQPTHYFNLMGRHEPVLRIAAGDTVVTSTVDAGGQDAREEQVTPGGNPQTGPFYIEGAEPGDTLEVHLDRIQPNRERGYTRSALAPRVVDPAYARELPDNPLVQWHVDTEAGTARPLDQTERLRDLVVPLAPMLGCFGVAPEDGQAISTATSAEHGGNMDYRGFVPGVTVSFPIFQPGALFTVGDCHAVQGDGEIVGTGIEISADVQFTVNVRKGTCIGWPRGENADFIFTVGNARPLDQAVQHATTEMIRWLRNDHGFTAVEASTLMGQCIQYDVGNVFDPAYTMVCKLPKRFLGM